MISLVRVDNRLLHGQILEAWVPRLRIDQVVVSDEEAAASPLAQAAMTLCVPPELPVRIARPEAIDFAALARGNPRVLVLVRDPAGLAAARAAGLTPALAPIVNLGNVHFGPGRRPVSPSVFLSEEELASPPPARRGGLRHRSPRRSFRIPGRDGRDRTPVRGGPLG